jgi:hypothetical protein
MFSLIGNILSAGLNIYDRIQRNQTKPSFKEFQERKKKMDNALADGDVDNIDTMFEWMSDRARAGKSGRTEPNK